MFVFYYLLYRKLKLGQLDHSPDFMIDRLGNLTFKLEIILTGYSRPGYGWNSHHTG